MEQKKNFYNLYLKTCDNLAAVKLLMWLRFLKSCEFEASYDDLVDYVGLSKRNVRLAVKYLIAHIPKGQEKPVLEIIRMGKGRKASVYKVNLPLRE